MAKIYRLTKLSFIQMVRRPVLLITVIFGASATHAQYYNTGTESTNVKWRQIQTAQFTIIYPQEADSLAQRYAWLFDHTYPAVAAPLRASMSRLPITLHPYNLYSNGMVVWAPKRMELYTTPPSSGYPQMWDKQLALHEIRHVAQMSKLHNGFFIWLHYLVGQQSEGIASGIYLYSWVLEGDAVVSETALSCTGRGRQPEFLMPLKAFALSRKTFSWDVWLNGSYRYNIPNEYQLGYALSAYAYTHAGQHIYGDALNYMTQRPLAIPPFSRGIKKYGGFTIESMFDKAFDDLCEQWLKDDSLSLFHSNVLPLVPPPNRSWFSYRMTTPAGKNGFAALRTDLSLPSRLVQVDSTGNERLLTYAGNINSRIRHAGNMLYWTATVRHERWEQVSFSVLQSYNLFTKKISTLTRRTRYFSPDISPDNQRMAVIENMPNGRHFITILNTFNYLQEKQFAVPAGLEPKELTWSSDGQMLYCTMLSDQGISLRTFDTVRQTWETLLPPSIASINHPIVFRHFVLFESGYSGTNNIYATDVISRQTFRLTDARFGAFDPAVSAGGDSLLFSYYMPEGYMPSSVLLDTSLWVAEDFLSPSRFAMADALSAQTTFNIDTLRIPDTTMYKSQYYNGFAHLLRIHSWAPFYFDPDELRSMSLDKDLTHYIGLGATILSQNTLNTFTSRAAYKYANGFNSGHLRFTYRGWYPVIEVSLDVNERHRRVVSYSTDIMRRLVIDAHSPSQPLVNISTRAYIPLIFTSGAWRTNVTTWIQYDFSNDEYFSMSQLAHQYHQSARAGILISRQLPMAHRDIFPRLGWALRTQYSFPVFNTNIYPVASIHGAAYLPGILPNHGILLTGGYQWHGNNDELRYSTFRHLSYPRGYTTETPQQLIVSTINYSLPLWYPDINVSWLVYFKRMRTNIFFDYAIITETSRQLQTYSTMFHAASIGADLLVDCHLLRFGYPISLGIRVARPLVNNTNTCVNLLIDFSI